MNLEHLVVPESKEELKQNKKEPKSWTLVAYVKGTREPPKRGPNDPDWSNLRNKAVRIIT